MRCFRIRPSRWSITGAAKSSEVSRTSFATAALPDGEPIPDYQTKSGLRFEQWVLDTCFRPYDQDWLNYQHEIALRHTSVKKNATDGVDSTPYIPLRDIIAFIAVMNETIKPYLSAKGHTAEDVEKMHRAWTKSLQLQIALWAQPYPNSEW